MEIDIRYAPDRANLDRARARESVERCDDPTRHDGARFWGLACESVTDHRTDIDGASTADVR